MTTVTSLPRSRRLVEVDALRGLAALAVVLFHFTTRFTELFHPDSVPVVNVSYGHYGVNLFFIISGFVIFMTLEKTARSMDFVVSRFSRLFPAYWVAIAVTFTITHWLGLPGKLVDGWVAMGNLVMLHALFKIPHVDGVYWTLEVELLFYGGMFLLYRLHLLSRIHHVLLGLVVVRIIYFVLEHRFAISLPWMIYRLLILQYIAWFALGISIYQVTSRQDLASRRQAAFTAGCAVLSLSLTESITVGLLSMVFALVVWLAAAGRLRLLRHGPFVWLGSISYPLYLLHENIGWSIQLRLGGWGLTTTSTALVALVAVLVLAAAVTRWVEQPAMRWIRARYRSGRPVPSDPAARAAR
jgi:peptidoglycan/LPS O-acetylase OafA/YrhL